MPGKFTYRGREYTRRRSPRRCRSTSATSIEFLTSFTHHPLLHGVRHGGPRQLNWDKVWNVPLDEFMQIIDNSLEKGYTISWGTDVSEKGFSRTSVWASSLKPTSKAWRAPKPRSGASSPRRRRKPRSTTPKSPAGAHHHAGTPSGGIRQLRDHRRPRHADRRHGHRPERNALLQGQELVEHDRSLRRLLVFRARSSPTRR